MTLTSSFPSFLSFLSSVSFFWRGPVIALICTNALAQSTPPAAAPAPAIAPSPYCPAAQAVKSPQLYGLWTVHFTPAPHGLPAQATMRMERHPEFSESLAGTISRNWGSATSPAGTGHAAQAELAGDIDEGIFVVDESSDRTSITGIWNGEVVEGSCGRQIKGVWKDTSPSAPADAPEVPFVLDKQPD